jgi:hypothetical protein
VLHTDGNNMKIPGNTHFEERVGLEGITWMFSP